MSLSKMKQSSKMFLLDRIVLRDPMILLIRWKKKPASRSVRTHTYAIHEPFVLITFTTTQGENFKNDMERTQTTVDIKLHENEDNDLNNETPPVTMEFSPKNADANKNSSTGSESRHRTLQQLAKLNATRLSSIKTPTHNQLANFPSNVIGSCFESSFLSENLQMIAAESPVKLIEDEPNPIPDTSPVTPLSDDACSNSEFEARLKMMRIAMLDSPAKSDPPAAVLSEQNLMTTTPTTSVNSPTLGTNAADVGKLLQDLKCLICEHVDISKREQFNKLLESIRAAVQCSTPTAEVSGRMGKESPHVYTRQATFDLDLELQVSFNCEQSKRNNHIYI